MMEVDGVENDVEQNAAVGVIQVEELEGGIEVGVNDRRASRGWRRRE